MDGRDALHSHHHAVQFYGDDATLFTTVAGFLSEGLVGGQPAVLIATNDHVAGILEQLEARFIDVEKARHIGDLVVLDADDTLATFMIDDHPDPVCFSRSIGNIITQALGGRTRTTVRAYGEMVDVLWRRGKEDAAIRLEILWNELANTHSFALLCGYSMGGFFKETSRLSDVSAHHTHIIDPHPNQVPFERRSVARQSA